MSKYDEIKTYIPEYYGYIQETNAYLQSLGSQLEQAETDTLQARDNNFIYRADEPTITNELAFLEIKYNTSYTLEEKRNLLASFYVGGGKIGRPEIKDIASVFTDSFVDVALVNSVVTVNINKDSNADSILDDILYILERKIPTHLGLIVKFRNMTFDEYDNYNYTWDEWDALNLAWDEWELYVG